MKTFRLLGAALAAVSFNASASAATLVNGSFESGLAGWTSSSSLTSAVSSHTAPIQPDGTYTPQDGTRFAVLQSGGGNGVFTTLSQTFTMNAGEILTGLAAFNADDYLPFNDEANVQISLGSAVLFYSNVAATGNYGNTPWTSFSFIAPTGGTYTLFGNVRNIADNGQPSYLYLDKIAVTGGNVGIVPEPATWAMMILGFGAVGSAMRRRPARRLARAAA